MNKLEALPGDGRKTDGVGYFLLIKLSNIVIFVIDNIIKFLLAKQKLKMQFFCVQITMCDHSWQSINVKAVPALPLREVLIPLTVPTKYQIHKHRQNCESPERQKNIST